MEKFIQNMLNKTNDSFLVGIDSLSSPTFLHGNLSVFVGKVPKNTLVEFKYVFEKLSYTDKVVLEFFIEKQKSKNNRCIVLIVEYASADFLYMYENKIGGNTSGFANLPCNIE